MKQSVKSVLAILIAISLGTGMAIAGSQKGDVIFNGLPIYAFCVITAFVINWLAFIPAFLFQTEKFFDLTGSITYITVVIMGGVLSSDRDARSLLILILVVIWAVRLGSFLFKRIRKDKKDGRFDELKPSFFRFLTVWTLQGLWVTFTLAAALVAITSSEKKELGVFAGAGMLIWIAGFVIEALADAQKTKWRAHAENKGKFINTGLWSKSRHPNYFGEILIWIGIAVIALPVLKSWQFFALVSPVFVTILLTRISGIPLLEKRADEKWGGMEDYEKYKENTPVLIPSLK